MRPITKDNEKNRHTNTQYNTQFIKIKYDKGMLYCAEFYIGGQRAQVTLEFTVSVVSKEGVVLM